MYSSHAVSGSLPERELRDGLARAVRLEELCIAVPVVQIAMSTVVGFGGPRRFASTTVNEQDHRLVDADHVSEAGQTPR